jgi:hypothetical protein
MQWSRLNISVNLRRSDTLDTRVASSSSLVSALHRLTVLPLSAGSSTASSRVPHPTCLTGARTFWHYIVVQTMGMATWESWAQACQGLLTAAAVLCP